MSQWINTLFLDFTVVSVTDQILYKLDQMVLLSSLLENISGFLSDSLDLTLIGITSLSELLSLFLSECIDKHSHYETILSLNIYKDINQSVPFPNELTCLVSSHI